MSLVVAAVNRRGIVIGTDRRTIAHSKKTGQDFVSTDTQVKLLVHGKFLIGVFGEGFSDPHDINTEIDKLSTIKANTSEELVNDYGPKLDKLIPGAGIIAANYSDSKPYLAAWHKGSRLPVSAKDDAQAETAIYFTGSGAPLARELYSLRKPNLPIFDTQKVIDYCVFLIQSVHLLQSFSDRKINSVGMGVTVGVADAHGAKILEGAELQNRRLV